MSTSAAEHLDDVFQALSSSTRRSILQKVSRRECAVGELAQCYSLSLAAVSKHIQSLEKAGLVSRRREGNFFYLKLDADGLAKADKWISHYRMFWESSLDSLAKFIEKEDQ